tara:strand:- start:234 stop:1139 length:906 start_codon:yes stop_codon:yes gene_type:complete
MSNQNINISIKNVKGKCDLKCAYNFKYKDSGTTAKNNEVMIQLSYDNGSVPPVLYNNEKYEVNNVMIVSPSIHMFNDTYADAEIIIEHLPTTGGPKFCVAIPIKSSTETSDATNLLNEIIQSVSTNAPSQGESTTLNISGFNLQSFVPNKPFFSYTDLENTEWVAFSILEYIPLSSSTIDTLKQIIKPFPIPTRGGDLFLNSSGPNTVENIGDGIYISCKPTGSSESETGVEYSTNTTSYDFGNILESPVTKSIFQLLIGCLIFLVIILGLNYVYDMIGSGEFKIPSIKQIQNSVPINIPS